MPGGSSKVGCSATVAPSAPTPCGTPTPRTSWRAEPTSGPSRSCSDTPTWRRPSYTLISRKTASGRSMTRPTPAPRKPLDDASVIEQLWQEYKASGRRDLRDRLILHYSPLVKFVAGGVAVGLPQNVEQSDLVSYGIFGLMDAIEKFDLSRGYKFETYAMSRIKGAIIDELRTIDWVPRSVRAKARA